MNNLAGIENLPKNLVNKNTLLRADLNIPLDSTGKIKDNTRLIAIIPTIKNLLAQGCNITIISHLGRPQPGVVTQTNSLIHILKPLEQLLNKKIEWLPGWPNSSAKTNLALAENVRFLQGETANSLELAKLMATNVDLFVMDAFGCSHRCHASTDAITKFVPQAVVGLLIKRELAVIEAIKYQSKQPLTLIIGGAKIESKLPLLKALLPLADNVLVGGGVANTFIKAQGNNIGKSLYDSDFVNIAQEVLNDKFHLPVDTICAPSPKDPGQIKQTTTINSDDAIFDIGPQTIQKFIEILNKSQTIIWAGPVGYFEKPDFSAGCRLLAKHLAQSAAFTIVGGGDTVSCIDNALLSKINLVSTGGGAFLEALQTMPKALVKYTNKHRVIDE